MKNIYALQNSNDFMYYEIMQLIIYDLNECLRIAFDIPFINIRNEKYIFKLDDLFNLLYKLMDEPTMYNALMLNFMSERMYYTEDYLLFVIEYYSFIKNLTIEAVGR